ncbi:uncharacterized protein [Primulina eburnea]|uniref:uncharacterized protein n=1 Tax=Primulina eburnea TaxID=1245227 RepID=UPI003C6BE819
MAENRDHQNELLREVPIREHCRPVINAHYSGIARGTIAANNFELKPALINMVQQNQFGGAATADPHLHLRTFLEITDTGSRKELAPISTARKCYYLGRFSYEIPIKVFSSCQVCSVENRDHQFQAKRARSVYEAWERYKELLRKCLNHGYTDWVQIELFYNSLDGPTRGNVDAAAIGAIFSKTPDETYELLEQMTINSYQWPSERSGSRKPVGVYAVDLITSLTAQVSALTAQIAAMNKPSQSTSEATSQCFKRSESGQFPSNIEVNPREQCKAVTLRSGKEIEVPEPTEESVEITVEEDEGKSASVKEEKVEEHEKVLKQQPLPKVNLPYPQRFKKKGLDDQFAKFLEIFKKIHINIPFADALDQMPNYTKFIKDVMSTKRKLQEFETVKLTEETLELGEVKPSTITLQLADRSLTYPRGIVEDVLVKVDKFIFPADFVILDMEEDQETPLIFGRPFLATGKTLIDVHKGELTSRVGGDEVVFNIYNTIKGPNEVG